VTTALYGTLAITDDGTDDGTAFHEMMATDGDEAGTTYAESGKNET